ncbi:MAG: penicillin-binding protein 2 [Candidatus Tectomicrobia bacterium]|nr:penicillin-binding protein 2 [Candidatus Tectomicrobia bacterium]
MKLRKLRRAQLASGTGNINRRVAVMGVCVLCLMGALSIRLWVLQVIQGDEFRRRSENNRIATKTILGLRGKILDRAGRLLAGNRPAFHLALIPNSVPRLTDTLRRLQGRTRLDPEWAQAQIRHGNPFKPIIVQRDLPREAVAQVMEHRWRLPGILMQVDPQREYPQKALASHLMGYLGEVTEDVFQRKKGYRPGDLMGKQGIERDFEDLLRGVKGKRWVEVDAFGRENKVIREHPAKPGRNLVLTLDLDLQTKAEALLGDQPGVLIAMDPRNGEILALASNPRFDPNALTNGMTPADWKALVQNPLDLLQDRATRGQYPPGSVFKIVLAAAGLEEKAIAPADTLFCPGSFRYGNRTFRCWRPQGHGNVNLHRALVESCDVYFYQLGLRLGIDRIARYASAFGLGRPTGLVAQGEKAGVVPSPEWKKKATGEPWYPGETVSIAIGQGYTLVTPIQMAVLISAVANGGTLYRPLLVRRVEESDGTVSQVFAPEVRGRLPVSPENLAIIRKALRGVVHDPRGTGFRAKIPGIETAGKTGTAQVVRLKHRKDSAEQQAGSRLARDHAWFVAFAPFEEPLIAVVVLAEHAGVGGSRYAPLARDLIAHHLGLSQGPAPPRARAPASPAAGPSALRREGAF